MNNYQINQVLQTGQSAISLFKNPYVHDSKRDSFLPHICGSLFFEKLKFVKKEKTLDVHIIALRESPIIYDFFCKYSLNFPVHIFQAIDSKGDKFNINQYKETHGIPPIKGQEKHLGCTLSHFYLWKKLKNLESDFYLVLEDDVFFTSYAQKALDYLVSNIPDDADLIFVNGRASEKLYAGCKYIDGSYSNTPDKMLFTRKEMLSIMYENFDSLRVNEGKKRILFSGTDGYILTKSGIAKLNDYVEKFGMLNKPGGRYNNVDLILTDITTDISDHKQREMTNNAYESIKNGTIREKAIITSYVSSFPINDVLERTGIVIEKKQKKSYEVTTQEVYLIRDSAIKLKSVNARYAFELMNLASKLRPEGKFIETEKDIMKKKLNLHWSQLKPLAQVNEEYKFFFIHIPKTGGSSVDDSNIFETPRYGHTTLQQFKKLLRPDFNSFKCFTFVRNPWDRLASAFYYISEGGSGSKWDLSAKDNHIRKYDGDFHQFLLSFIVDPSRYLKLLHFKPMVDFFHPKECYLDFYIQKLENVKNLTELNHFLGLEVKLPHKRKRLSYSNVKKTYNEELFLKVKEIFIDDVKIFGYESFTLKDIKNN